MSRVRALLATARIANVPSVVSNVSVGYFLAMGGTESLLWGTWFAAITSGILIYLAGNFANDWYDRAWDVQHRPERALPAGLFSPSLYLTLAIALATVGIIIAAVATKAGYVAALIAVAVVIYTHVHKRSASGVLWVGLCRGLLYLLGFFGVHSFRDYVETLQWLVRYEVWPIIGFNMLAFVGALGLASYVIGLSLYARCEALAAPPTSTKRFALFLLGVPILTHTSWIFPVEMGWYSIPGILCYVAWLTLCVTRLKKPIPRLVSGLLAGIPLVDAMILFPCAIASWMTDHRQTALVLFAIPILAFVLGRLLQRIAPAT